MPRLLATASLLAALACLSPFTSGCGGSYIHNTDVPDEGENRKIIEFCERYRRAIEERDIESLVAMASPRYFETGGNAKPTDDIDYNGLRAFLTERFSKTKAVRYEIRYRRVSETENKVIFVEFTYTASFLIPTSKGDMWQRAVRDNRLLLVREQDSFRIVGGM